MPCFDHHKLTVYRESLAALRSCDAVVAQLPPGPRPDRSIGHIDRGKLDRSATSIVANIAEGAGEFSPREKARFYRMAKRSAVEVAAWLDVIEQREEAPQVPLADARSRLQEVVAMLVTMIRRCSDREQG